MTINILGQTPMMMQYENIKNQYPDAILFFRLGDFYEMFGSDAVIASRELEITLTGRDAGMDERVPMCGVPYHAAENYINRLISKGYKVAVCEQVEDPRMSKGIVRREVIRVVTPGTSLETQFLQNQTSTYLLALSYRNQVWGLSACDVSTGEFWVTEFNALGELSHLKDEIYRLNPLEILVPQEGVGEEFLAVYHSITACLESPLITVYKKEAFDYSTAKQCLIKHFKVRELEELGIPQAKEAVSCGGAILSYLLETLKTAPDQIKKLSYNFPQAYLQVDATSFRNLELTKTIRSNEKKGSLMDILDRTKTALGARLLRHWLERPLTQKAVLECRFEAVEELVENWAERQALRNSLDKVYDLERLITRVLYGKALPRELISLKESLGVLPQLKTVLSGLTGSKLLQTIHDELDALEDIYSLIEMALEPEPPFQIKEGGVIKVGYHSTIDFHRKASQSGKSWIAQLEREEREKTGIKSLKIGFNKVFGYYLEVTKANYSMVPEYFQRKQTLANCERYVTDELKKLEDQVLGAEEKLLVLEEAVYYDLLTEIGTSVERIQETSRLLAQTDVLQSLADTAVLNSYVRPQLMDKEDNTIIFSELRHPVVERVLKDTRFVPNDLEFTPDINMFIITGPNMGGKSTYCRSTALAVIMAQMGSFVPAKFAQISLRDKVFARVGANDDLGSGQSTFMVEMNEVANILQNATPHSLVILDEVGRGTSTYDGMSMAWAVGEYLVEHLKPKVLFATHYHELTRLEDSISSIKNLSVSAREIGDSIIFLHKIIDGPADRSYGIQVGSLAGLPTPVIKRAREILSLLENDELYIKESPESSGEQKDDRLFKEDKDKEIYYMIETVLKLDLTNTTPLEALNKLFELRLALDSLREKGVAAK